MFEPHFYHEVPALPRRAIIRYFIRLLAVFSIVTAGADTWYLVQELPEALAAAFPGLELRDGTLHPPVDTPYYPPGYLVAPLFNQLFALQPMFNDEADSIVLVDTAAQSKAPLKVPLIILKAKTIEVILGAGATMKFTYEQVLFGTKNLLFTADHLHRFLLAHVAGVLIGYLFSTLVHLGGLILFSIFFLAGAAFIFSVDRQRTFREYLKIASFAVSPIAVGSTLVAISGVKITWIWHLLIFLSTIVMFRAILAINLNSSNPQEQ